MPTKTAKKNAKSGSPAPISEAEYRARVATIQKAMARERLDALLITSEDNYRYITGFNSPTWHNLTRPRYCVVPLSGDPSVIVPANNTAIIEETSWVKNVKWWIAPCPADDGVTLTIDALKACAGKFKRVGAELGPQSRLTMPVGDFFRIKEGVAPIEVVDGDWMLREIRMVKSPAEVEHLRFVAQAVSRGFEALSRRISAGETEKQVAEKLQADFLRRGVEKIPYLVGVSGAGGYRNIHLSPQDRVLRRGDVLVFDTGCSYKGYYCDFDREYSFGKPSNKIARMYDIVWKATQAGIDAVRPGATCSDVWHAQAKVILDAKETSGLDFDLAKNGRMGHGLGMRMCEPPSIHPEDFTVLKAGMTITIEPGISYTHDGKSGPEPRVMVHEENVTVTEDGVAMLTRRAPPEMSVVR
ncbi:MAG: aminopeptidase P family protein [Rhodospirillales bacterium]|nr:aminopeptidase P family protein [Rhodospirillales bacterium]